MVANTTNGYEFIIDEEDSYLLNDTWHLSKSGYVLRNKDLAKLHRVIMNAKKGEIIDHKDQIKTNNSKKNLRLASICQNVHNQSKRKNTKTKYKGVQFKPDIKLYESRCRMNGLDFHLGSFITDYSAAYAYNKKALELSEFACVNELEYSFEYLEEILISHRRTSPVAEKRSKYKNVYWNKKNGRMKTGKWTTLIIINNIRIDLGRYNSDVEAYDIYVKAFSIKDQFNGDRNHFRNLLKK